MVPGWGESRFRVVARAKREEFEKQSSRARGGCVWEGGVSVRAPDVDELVRTAGCREPRERGRGEERGASPRRAVPVMPPLLAPSVRSAWVCGPGIGYAC